MELLEGYELAPLKKQNKTTSPVGQDLEVRANGERVSTICFLYPSRLTFYRKRILFILVCMKYYLLREVHSLSQFQKVLPNEESVGLQIKSVFLKKKSVFLLEDGQMESG